ncbi:hypothetical protein [Sphingobium indicum]|uniref:hypothetical protein n=1 Tax=Sphingobium indicum TaxID=332055 RepID=UPI0013149671|nr:hypothetical protein [Sphingobium indicum]
MNRPLAFVIKRASPDRYFLVLIASISPNIFKTHFPCAKPAGLIVGNIEQPLETER